MDVLEHTEQQLIQYNLLNKGARIVSAVSGGPDSMALFHVLHKVCAKWDVELIAAHLNHSFRIEESRKEAELVSAFAERLGRPIQVAEIDVPSYIAQTGENAQAAARKKRYEFLHEVCRQTGAEVLATAHHADDQAETIFMRILKGASVKSLSGMTANRLDRSGICIIRPLLDVTKQQLLNYCKQHEIRYAMDSSNEQTEYFRNQVRLEIFPYLHQFQPQLTQAIHRLGKIASLENEWMEEQAEKFVQQHVVFLAERRLTLDRQELLKLHPALQRRVIPLILNYLAFGDEQNYEYVTIESIYTAIHNELPPSVQLHLPSGIQFIREYDRLYMQDQLHANKSEPYEYELLRFPVELKLQEAGWTVTGKMISCEASLPVRAHPYEIYLDADQLELPLTVRSRRPGDRMSIIGMNGTKKVKDILIDDKVPPSQRGGIPLLIDGKGDIIWIAGIRYSGAFSPNHTSRNILHIICCPNIN